MDNFKSMSHFSELIMVELSTCADNDNFGGQNKNCIVVWFIICLVETFFFTSETTFYVRLHEKICLVDCLTFLRWDIITKISTSFMIWLKLLVFIIGLMYGQ